MSIAPYALCLCRTFAARVMVPIQVSFSLLGPEILQQIHNHLSPIPFEISNLGRELLERRYALIVTIRGKHRADRAISVSGLIFISRSTFLTRKECLKMTLPCVRGRERSMKRWTDVAQDYMRANGLVTKDIANRAR